jgi:iron complex transport system substrate-binding protein
MKKIIAALASLLLLLTVSACGTAASAGNTGEQETIKIKGTNGTVSVPKHPKRIVVLDYGVLDSLDKLGASSHIVGLPRQNVPAYLKQYDSDKYANLGNLKEVDLEKINSLEPDLIISSNRLTDLNEKFEKIAPTLQLTVDEKNYLDSFKENTLELAKIVGKTSKAKAEIKKIDQKIADLKARVPEDQKTLTIIANEGKASAFGSGSRYGLINDLFGFTSVDSHIEASPHGQSISTEYISKKNPDYLFVVDRSAVVTQKPSAKQVIENDLVKRTSAYKNKHIVLLNPEVWYFSGGGIESLNIMIDEVAGAVK